MRAYMYTLASSDKKIRRGLWPSKKTFSKNATRELPKGPRATIRYCYQSLCSRFWPFFAEFYFSSRQLDGRPGESKPKLPLSPTNENLISPRHSRLFRTKDAALLRTVFPRLVAIIRTLRRKCCEGFSIVFRAEGERMKIAIRNQATSFLFLLLRRRPEESPPDAIFSIREIGNYWFRVLDFFPAGDTDHLGIRQAVMSEK